MRLQMKPRSWKRCPKRMELALQEEIISQANGLSPLCEWKIADDQGFWLVLTMLRATRAWLVTLESLSTRRFCQHGRQVAEVKLGRDRRL